MRTGAPSDRYRDRVVTGTRDLVAKFTRYTHYVAPREWFREKPILPLLLVVAPDKAQEMRIARIVDHVIAEVPGLLIWTTTATRLEERGKLADILYQVLPKAGGKEMITRRQLYAVSN